MKHFYLLLSLIALCLTGCKEEVYVLDSYSTMRYDVLALPLPGDTLALRTVDFVSDREGFAGGDAGTFFSTTDAGLTWTRNPQPDLGRFNKLVFTSATNGWAATSTGLYRTTNGGKNWSRAVMPAFHSTGTVYDVQFVTPQVGYAVGTLAAVYKTTNGGTSWTNLHLGRERTYNLEVLSFTSVDSGTVIGTDQARWRTSNGGRTWDILDYNSGFRDQPVYDMIRFSLKKYVLATETGFESYEDGDAFPSNSDEPYDYPVYGLASAGPGGPVVGVGERTIIRRHEDFTKNEHTPWVYVHSPDGSTIEATFYAADFANASTFYAVGARGSVYRFHYQ